MQKVFIINGAQRFAHSRGNLNQLITDWDLEFFTAENGFDLKITHVSEGYQAEQEVDKFVWADIIIYHFPIWWFSMPFHLKEYLDLVLTAGHKKIYYSDGRKAENPAINYGTGGLLHGKRYMVSTTWNAPETAFTLPNEFFQQKSVDEGVLFPFHRMNAFIALTQMESIHFHDVEKNMNNDRLSYFKNLYLKHLSKITLQLSDC